MLKSEDLVSIIVPVYKVEAYLDKCVESLVNQTYTNLEIILVDDGSPDNCPAMCDAWAERDSRIVVIHKLNEGVSAARNSGLAVAEGKWIVFVDSDDVVSERMVSALIGHVERENAIAAVGISRFEGRTPTDAQDPLRHVIVPGKNLNKVREGLFACGVLYNRHVIEKDGLYFDKRLRNLEDAAWNGIYLRYTDNVVLVDNPLYYYRRNPASITSKCVDPIWQIQSWYQAQFVILNWFAARTVTKTQKKEIYQIYRLSEINIHAESLVAQLPYKVFQEIRKEAQKAVPMENTKNVTPKLDYYLRRYFPGLHYLLYISALKLRNSVVNLGRG